MAKEPASAHSPGSQGHDKQLLDSIKRLEDEHDKMMGNQASDTQPEDETDDFSNDATGKLYRQQAPRDWHDRRTAEGKGASWTANTPPNVRRKAGKRGDESGNY